MLQSRNTFPGFAGRTHINLEYMNSVFVANPKETPVRIVTQVVNSLLGLVIVPEAKIPKDHVLRSRTLQQLKADGWPEWDITLDEPEGDMPKTETLGTLIWHLRNAAAHGRFKFHGEPESRHLEKVTVAVKDKPAGKNKKVNWRAEIRGDHLYQFCLRLAEAIEATK